MNTSRKIDYRTAIITMALAFFLWLVVKMNQTYDYEYEIPLETENINPGKCLKHPVSDKVRVEFRSNGWDLLWLNFRNIVYEIDLSDVQEKVLVNLSEHPQFVRFPEGVPVPVKSIVRPQRIVIELDDLVEKTVSVILNYDLRTKAGYTHIDALPVPDSIKVQGPAAFLDTLNFINTKMKSFENKTYAFKEEFEVKKNPNFFANYIPEKLVANFDVQSLSEKELNNVPVEVINIPFGYDIVPLPSVVNIYIKGGENILANATVDDFKVTINFKRDWQKGVDRVPAEIDTDLKLLYVESRPSQFGLIVQKKKSD